MSALPNWLEPLLDSAQQRATEAYKAALSGEAPEPANALIAFPSAAEEQTEPVMPEVSDWAYVPEQQAAYENTENPLADPLNTRAAAISEAGAPPPLPSAEDTPLGA